MWYLRAYIDKPGGITVNDCEAVSRRLSDILDEKDFIEDSYVLEVSSPGLGRPLKKEKDYKRNLGKEVAQEGSTSESPIRPISQRSQSQGHDRVHLYSRFSHQADVRTRIRAQPTNHHAESARHGADGLIVKGEMQQSTGGRKAQIYEFAAHSSVAIGVRIQTTRITAIAIDLNGKSVATRQRTLPYRNNDAYYQRMNGIINDFAQELAKQGSTVRGVAFCMQGIVSADGQSITFGKIMNNTGLKLNELSHGLNYPSLMIHDSDASAWRNSGSTTI